MPHELTIGGRKVSLAWNMETQRRYHYRASCIGGAPSFAQLRSPKTAAAALTKLLWLVLPSEVHALYPSPEDLHVALDHEQHGTEIHAAIVGIVADMAPSDEKKSTSASSPSPGSSSG